LDLGDASEFEQSAAVEPGPLVGDAGDLMQPAMPAYANRQPSGAEEMDRSAVIAIWIGGGAVGLLFLAIVLTSLLRGCGETSSEPLATDAQSDETAPEVPAKSKPADESTESEAAAEPVAAKSDADSGKQGVKEDRQKSSSKEPPRKPAPKKQGREQVE
jgi:hypothetical protein